MEKSTAILGEHTGTLLHFDGARKVRERAVAQVRRELIMEAARGAFFELGLDGASLREIAKRAGYSPGALYSYFASKEEIYAALLGESLDRLNRQVEAAGTRPPARKTAPQGTLRATAQAFFDFYRDNPRDLDLGFYLFHGMQPMGLTPQLNKRLNEQLRAALAPMRDALAALGMPAKAAQAEITSLFAHIVGLLVLSHTGRIRMFKQDPKALFDHYLNALLARAAKP
jgi:AcrR family transcriptional regulator